MSEATTSTGRVAISELALATLRDRHVRGSAEDLGMRGAGELDVVVAMSSELLDGDPVLPSWVDAETRYLVIADVPIPALVRLAAALGLHKPHLRLHVSADPGAVKRLVLAQARAQPREGIVDAYVLGDLLIVVHGDMSIREFRKSQLPRVRGLRGEGFGAFEIDTGGSYLYWPANDTHLGASHLLQAVDPMYVAEVQVERYRREKVSLVLLEMREEWGLKQTDIAGLSDRHVRRLENEEARLTVESARAFSAAFGMALSEFLEELGKRLSALNEMSGVDRM